MSNIALSCQVLDSSIHEMNKNIRRGINFGNFLENNEGDWRVEPNDGFFVDISNAGFDSIRIPIKWSAHSQIRKPYLIDDDFFDEVSDVIDISLSHKLIPVINMHHYTSMMREPEKEKGRFLSMWKQISMHYASYESSSLYFELLNEPNSKLTPELWNEYISEAISVIRSVSPDRVIIIGTWGYNSIDYLNKLQLPENDCNLIVSVHYYKPYKFIHQGIDWIDGSDNWLGTTWKGTDEEKKNIIDDFDIISDWSKAKNRPVYLGEFGVYYKIDNKSKFNWLQFVRVEAEKRDISWAYWSFTTGFGIYDMSKGEWNLHLLKALHIPN
jgi:endoglucanase